MKSVEDRREEILEGPIIKTLLVLSWPIVIGSMLQTGYNMADTFWLGRVSEQALAAPSVAFPLVMVLLSLGMGLATAGISLVSQHTGKGGSEKANESAGQVFGLLLVISIIVGAVGFVSAGWVFRNIIGVPEEVYPLALSYIRIIFLGAPITYAFTSFRFILRGVGDMKTAMYLRAVGVVLNIVLDPLLILGIGPFPALGVTGAAIATVTTRGVASAVGIYLLFTGKVGIKLKLYHLKLKMRWVKKIFDIGLPASGARAGSALGFVGLITIVSVFGTIPLSAYSIGRRVIQLVNLGIWGFASATMTMVGQNIGAGKTARAEKIVKKTIMVSIVLMVALSIIIYIFRAPLVGIFADEAALENYTKVMNETARFVAIFVFAIPFYGLFRIFDSTYRGTGHTKPAMVLSLTRIMVLRICLSYVLAFSSIPLGFATLDIGAGLGIVGVWYGMSLSNIIIAFFSYGYFRTGKWKEKTIEDEKKQDEEEGGPDDDV
ncbi:MAG: MATE family efflux transporter [Candidatus Natronoplasma sp.]